MSLVLRTNLSRPLTHEELDSNLTFLHLKGWIFDDYRENQLVYQKNNDDVYIIYRCKTSHVRYVYGQAEDFAISVEVDGSTIQLWEAITGASTGGGGDVGSYDPVLPDGKVVTQTIGGFVQGTTVGQLRDKSFTEMFNQLLFPTITPTYVAPSATVSASVGSLAIAGTTPNLTLTATLNRGQILEPWNGNNLQNFRSGAALNYTYLMDSTILTSGNQIGTSTYTQNSFPVTLGAHTFQTQIVAAAGPQPVDNFGQNFGSPLAQGSVAAAASFEGVYPLFATSSVITTLTQQTLVSMISGNNISLVLTGETSGNKQKFAIPQAWITSRALTAVQYLNPVTQTFITVNKLSEFTSSSTTITVAGSSINYVLYTYNSLSRGEITIRLIF